MTLLRACRTCAARPALLHEKDCFDCFSMKEAEREVVRLGRQLADAQGRIAALEQKVGALATRLRAVETRRTQRRRDQGRLHSRRYRQRHLEERRAYNREWMRAYRSRKAA